MYTENPIINRTISNSLDEITSTFLRRNLNQNNHIADTHQFIKKIVLEISSTKIAEKINVKLNSLERGSELDTPVSK